MYSSTALIVSALVARAVADYSYTFPPGFNLGAVDDSTKRSWCLAEQNTCPQICGGAANPNTCDPDTLNFDCTCINGTVPNVDPYINTIPFFVCQENYDQCIQNHPNDLEGQKECKDNAKCGSITASIASATSTVVSSSSTLSTTAQAKAPTSATATAATGTSSATTGAAVAVQPVQGQSAGFLTAAAMAVLGLLM